MITIYLGTEREVKIPVVADRSTVQDMNSALRFYIGFCSVPANCTKLGTIPEYLEAVYDVLKAGCMSELPATFNECMRELERYTWVPTEVKREKWA
jgi:hypothetical protein